MSLSVREQETLDLIRDRLTGSDSGLAALLGTFNRLAAGEEMPVRERIRPGSREAAGCAGRGRRYAHRRCRYPRQGHQHPSHQWGPPLLWLAITLSLITVALVFSRSTPSRCGVQLATVCSHADTARSLYPAFGNGS